MNRPHALLVAALFTFGATSVQAQSPVQRPGIVVGVGVGFGALTADCGSCGDASVGGIDREVSVAVALGSRVHLGVTVAGWVGSDQGYSEKEAAILLAARVYPVARWPLHVDAGFGPGRYRIGYQVTGSPKQRVAADANAFAVGVGYDLVVQDRLVVVPQISIRTIGSAPLKFDGEPIVESGFRTVAIGAAIRWRAVPFGVERERR